MTTERACSPRDRDGAASGVRAAISVLVVEDDELVARAVVELLQCDGYRVRHASNGAEALVALRAELPAVMLLDARMPVMDGYEVRRQQLADRALRDVPVIVTSGHFTRPFDDGVVVLPKPFDFETLSRVVASSIASRDATPRREAI